MEDKELMTKFLEMRKLTMKLAKQLQVVIENDGNEWLLRVNKPDGNVLHRSYSMFYIWKKVAELHKRQFGDKNE